jgi:acetyl-CoA carboxylase biotin carboxyl carrier protein
MIFKDIDVKELFKLMQEHDITEVSLQDGKVLVDVKRGKESLVISQGALQAQAVDTVPSVANNNTIQKEVVEKVALAPEVVDDHFHIVEAPLVGTFYRASSPDSDPFVEVGDRVQNGDVLCIVEAMKSMNEIQSDVSGIVKEICVENAGMVEFEQALFKIEA